MSGDARMSGSCVTRPRPCCQDDSLSETGAAPHRPHTAAAPHAAARRRTRHPPAAPRTPGRPELGKIFGIPRENI